MTLTAYRFGLAAAAAIVLGLLSVMDGSEPWAQGQPPCTVTVKPGESIQKAIDGAKEGAVICLAAGMWSENIKIGKPLTLRGLGQGQTIIKGKSEYPVIRIESETVIKVTIEKLTIANGWNGLRLRGSASVSLTDSAISDNKDNGLDVGDSAQVSLTNSTVSKNGSDGLDVWGSASVSLTNSTVSNNGEDGLEVWNSAKVELRSSIIEGNGANDYCQWRGYICTGITVRNESQTTITDSKIINNTDWGLAAWLERCGYYGDYFTGKVTIDEKTVIEGNNKSGNHTGQVCLP